MAIVIAIAICFFFDRVAMALPNSYLKGVA